MREPHTDLLVFGYGKEKVAVGIESEGSVAISLTISSRGNIIINRWGDAYLIWVKARSYQYLSVYSS